MVHAACKCMPKVMPFCILEKANNKMHSHLDVIAWISEYIGETMDDEKRMLLPSYIVVVAFILQIENVF